ncbi:MAG: alpha-L-fucosidase [Clostridia bacterium]|nr:alpha-L-fucosidase [Clostridia bacterium]
MTEKIIKPTIQHVKWADCEIGVIIHLDLTIYKAPYDCRQHFGDPIPASVFDPSKLNTDQWIASAKALGAKYAILVAKHGTGFSLWPTEAHDYSVKNSPYKNGQGDIVKEFIASCKKYDVYPGIYCSASFNQCFSVENPGRVLDNDPVKQAAYNKMVEKQLTELWTNYGEWFEIWFDGGVIPVEEGGPDVSGLLHKLQPDAVVFQGPVGTKSLIRWAGNERGMAAENCSSLYDDRVMAETGVVEKEDSCDDFSIWCPAESDFPNRYAEKAYQGGWFWRENEEDTIIPADVLFSKYLTSVGRNTNMLVGMVINTDGEFPESDLAEFKKAGELIRNTFGTPIAVGDTKTVVIPSESKTNTKYLVMQEDIAHGELVTGYTVSAYDGSDKEIFTYRGTVISHKRILEIPNEAVMVKLEITSSRAEPKLLPLAVYGKN